VVHGGQAPRAGNSLWRLNLHSSGITSDAAGNTISFRTVTEVFLERAENSYLVVTPLPQPCESLKKCLSQKWPLHVPLSLRFLRFFNLAVSLVL
jgi:hypothetical protein